MIGTRELAQRLGVSISHARNLIASGKIEAVNVGSGSRAVWRVPICAIERYESRSTNRKIQPKRSVKYPFDPVFRNGKLCSQK